MVCGEAQKTCGLNGYDDLNTSGALAVLFELTEGLRREGNRLLHEGQTQWVNWMRTAIADLISSQTARQQRDFITADDIRDQLAAAGVTVVDQPNRAVRWH
ncbi:MAG: DALR domain-containing protein [Cyanobacteria bacterium P01_A01_bin.15]